MPRLAIKLSGEPYILLLCKVIRRRTFNEGEQPWSAHGTVLVLRKKEPAPGGVLLATPESGTLTHRTQGRSKERKSR